MSEKTNGSKKRLGRVIVCSVLAVALLAAGIGIGYGIHPKPEIAAPAPTGDAANSAYEYMVGATAWQMSAEAHALMMQGFHIAQSNLDDLVALADAEQQGYRWVEDNGQRKLFFEEKQVAVICDIDDTLVDGVHYTANVIGQNGMDLFHTHFRKQGEQFRVIVVPVAVGSQDENRLCHIQTGKIPGFIVE